MTTYGMESEPPRCPNCGASLGTLESLMKPRCYSCGKPFPGTAAPHVPAEPALTVPDGLDSLEQLAGALRRYLDRK